MRILIRKIVRDLLRRRLRNSLTLFGVVLGVAGVVAISTTTSEMVDAQRLTYNSSNQADLAAFTGSLSPTILNLVERRDNVAIVDSRSVTATRFSTGTGWENVQLIGIDEFSEIRLDTVELSRGRFPQRGEIAFDESARELAPIEIGDTVAIQRSSAEDPAYFTVSGFTHSPATLGAGIMNRAVAYTTADEVQTLTERDGDNFLLVRVSDAERSNQTARDISGLLSKRGVSVGTFEVRDPTEFVGSRELGTLLLLLRIFSVLGAALAAFLVANTLSAVMGEETTQIGVMKAMGGTQRQIVQLYLLYSAVLGLAGAILGFALGTFGGRALSSFLTNITGLQQPSLSIEPLQVALALGVGLAVTVAATLIPTVRAARREVAPMLRSPGVRSEFQRPMLRSVIAPISRLSRTASLGVLNVIRRPGRTAMTVTVVSVAVAAFISTQALSSSVSGTVDELYALYGADGWVFFRQPVDVDFVKDLEKDPFVLQAEPWTTATGAIGSTRTDIWGMPADDPLYDYRLVEGAWFQQANPVSIVLTSNLAASVDARVGEQIVLDIGSQSVNVQVSGIVNDSSTYLGSTTTGKVFMPYKDLHRITGRGQRSDLFALKFRSSDPESVDAALAAMEERYSQYAPGTLAAYSDQASAEQAINILTVLLRAMVILVGIVGLAGIANTLFINITERRREFGVARAIGAQTRHVLTILIGEGLALATSGLVIGTLIGYPLAQLLVDLTGQELFELTFHLSPGTVAATFILALLAVAAVSSVPGLAASRIRPLEVLRYE